MLGKPGGWGYRLGPSVMTGLVLLGFAVVWRCDRGLYLALRDFFIWKSQGDAPFSDLNAVLQAGACWRQGIDVLAPNACMGGGMFNYSPVLLRIGWLGLGPGVLLACGLGMAVAFIAACALLPPARTLGEVALRCAMMCSCAGLHAFECGNIDLAIFVLAAVGVALQRTALLGRLTGYALFVLGAALKFYPAVLLGLLLHEPRRRAAWLGVVLVLGTAVLLLRHWQVMAGILGTLPLGLPFYGSFGAVNLPFGVVMLLCMSEAGVDPSYAVIMAAVRQPHFAAAVILATKLLVVAGILVAARLAPHYTAGLAALDEARRLFLAAGAMLLAFCFFTAPNYEYRAVFLLLTVPGLYALAGQTGVPRLLPVLVLVLLPVLLYERVFWDFFRGIGEMLPERVAAMGGIGLWLLREAAWWFIMLQFAAIGFAFVFGRLRTGSVVPRAVVA